MGTTLSHSDLAVMIVYLGALSAVGFYFARQKRTLKSYLLADQGVHWIVVGISVLAALFSGISYLGAPAETFFYDLRYLWVVASFLIATPITTLVFLPLFRRAQVFTAYGYLERRFDWRVRRLASLLFILRVAVYLGFATYAPALAIVDVTGWPLWLCCVVTGGIATAYTALGGMKAVVWTDTIQFLILCGGIFVIIGVALHKVPGGLGEVWRIASSEGKTGTTDLSLNPAVRITVWSALLGGACNNLVQMVTDQIAVQRYITAKSLRDSKRALWLKFWVTLPLIGLFYLTGTILYGYYRALPSRTPDFVNASLVPAMTQGNPGVGPAILNDRLLPYFVVHELPAPVPGILIAAILGATIAVVSAGVNALATTTLMDFRSKRSEDAMTAAAMREDGSAAETRQVNIARLLTLGYGAFVTIMAVFVIPHLGSLIEGLGKITGLFGGPLLGVFLLAALTRRTNGTGAIIGATVGFIVGTMLYLAPMFHLTVSFLWISFGATLATCVVGWLASFLSSPPEPGTVVMTIYGSVPHADEGDAVDALPPGAAPAPN